MTKATRSALPAASKPFIPPRSDKMPLRRTKRMTGSVSESVAIEINSEPIASNSKTRGKKKDQLETGAREVQSEPVVNEMAMVVHETESAVQSQGKKRKTPVDWSDSAISTMLALMKEYKVHNNGSINLSSTQWREIMTKLQKTIHGLEELRQLRNKWDKLQIKFRDEKEASQRTGSEPSSWPWFDVMDDLKHGVTNDKDIPGAGDDGDFGAEAFEEADMYPNTYMSDTFYETIGTNVSFEEEEFVNLEEENPASPIGPDLNANKDNSGAQGNSSSKDTPSTINPTEVSPRSAACNQPGVSGKPTARKRSRIQIDEEIASGISNMASNFGDSEKRKLDYMMTRDVKKDELIRELETMRSSNTLKIAQSMASMTESICQMTKDTLLEIAKIAAAKPSN